MPSQMIASSRSIQTSQCLCSTSTVSPSVTPETSETFECFVCNQLLDEPSRLKEHAKDEHRIKLQSDKLSDFSVENPFIRFVKSIYLEPNYISERLNLYPENWDHIEEKDKDQIAG